VFKRMVLKKGLGAVRRLENATEKRRVENGTASDRLLNSYYFTKY